MYVFSLVYVILLHLDSRQTLSQREKELMGSADKCRETMESQVSDLRKQCSSLELEITSAREDGKSLQQQLRDKVSLKTRTPISVFRADGCCPTPCPKINIDTKLQDQAHKSDWSK